MEGSKRDSLSSIGSTEEKKRRSRRRKLQSNLCSQVEFYFSDANLRKDRFLNQMISKSSDRYVRLTLIASFNKIQSLTDDVEIIAKALQRSKVVELSPDGTQIRRRKPLEEPKYNPDDCTVYVECLPRTADIGWIQKTFKYCGNVVYVSLPRYQSTGDIKGFAFVEYENPEEAQRACKLLNNPLDIHGPPGMFPKTRKGKFVNIDLSQISLDHRNTKGLKEGSVQRREAESGDHSKKHLKRKHPHEDREKDEDEKLQEKNVNNGLHREKKAAISKQKKKTAENEENRKKRRHKSETDNKEGDGRKKKKHHKDDDHTKENKEEDERRENVQSSDEKHEYDEDRKSRKRKNIDRKDFHQKKRKVREDGEAEMFENLEDNQEASKNKKIKTPTDMKDNEKKKKRYRQKKEKEEEQLYLRVLPKTEWLKLKDQYLHLQKQGLQEMKTAIRAQWKSKVNENNQRGKPAVTKETHKEASAPDFIEGVVLRIQSTEPIKSRKDFREKLEATAPVAYVDLEDGDTGGFVRFKFQQAAEKVLSQEIDGLEAISFTLLTGDEENKYWKKLNSDWKSKLLSNAKRKKKRGKARVIQRAKRATTSNVSTHITFNDDDEEEI